MEVFEKRGAIVRTAPDLRWLACIAAVAAWPAANFYTDLGSVPALGFFAAYGSCLFALHFLTRTHVWRTRRVDVRADAKGLWGDGRCLVQRAGVERARVRRAATGLFVRFDRFEPPSRVELRVKDETEARALIDAMRLDAKSSLARFAFCNGSRRRAVARVAMLVGFPFLAFALLRYVPASIGIEGVLLIVLALLALATGAYAILGPMTAHVVVGADGLRIRSSFSGDRFVPYALVDRVDMAEGELRLRLLHGSALILSYGGPGISRYLLAADLEPGENIAEAFVRRLGEHLAEHRARAHAHRPVAPRAGRSATQWLRDLGALRAGRAAYRDIAVPTDDLWCVLEDAAAPATARVGAAFVLAPNLDETGRARLRAATEACACRRTRAAIETGARPGDPTSLVPALDDLEDPSGGRARTSDRLL